MRRAGQGWSWGEVADRIGQATDLPDTFANLARPPVAPPEASIWDRLNVPTATWPGSRNQNEDAGCGCGARADDPRPASPCASSPARAVGDDPQMGSFWAAAPDLEAIRRSVDAEDLFWTAHSAGAASACGHGRGCGDPPVPTDLESMNRVGKTLVRLPMERRNGEFVESWRYVDPIGASEPRIVTFGKAERRLVSYVTQALNLAKDPKRARVLAIRLGDLYNVEDSVLAVPYHEELLRRRPPRTNPSAVRAPGPMGVRWPRSHPSWPKSSEQRRGLVGGFKDDSPEIDEPIEITPKVPPELIPPDFGIDLFSKCKPCTSGTERDRFFSGEIDIDVPCSFRPEDPDFEALYFMWDPYTSESLREYAWVGDEAIHSLYNLRHFDIGVGEFGKYPGWRIGYGLNYYALYHMFQMIYVYRELIPSKWPVASVAPFASEYMCELMAEAIYAMFLAGEAFFNVGTAPGKDDCPSGFTSLVDVATSLSCERKVTYSVDAGETIPYRGFTSGKNIWMCRSFIQGPAEAADLFLYWGNRAYWYAHGGYANDLVEALS